MKHTLSDITLEYAALSAMQNGDVVLCKQLEPEDFSTPLSEKIFRLVQDSVQKHGMMDVSEVQESLQKVFPKAEPYVWLVKITEAPYMGAPQQIVKRLKILRARREARYFEARGDDLPQEFFKKGREIQQVLDSRTDTTDELVARIKKGVEKIPTGFHRMDYLCNGGIECGGMLTIAAMEGTGKTALAVNIAKNVISLGKSVCFVTLEMAPEGILQRFMQSFWGKTREEVREHIDDMKALPAALHVIAPGYDINRVIAAMVQFLDCELFVLDYFDLLTSDTKENHTTKLETHSHQLKEFVFENRKAMVVLSQINKELQRSTANREPVLADLHGTSALSKDSHTVSFLWDKNYRSDSSILGDVFQKKMQQEGKDLRWLVKKNRNGMHGGIMMKFDPLTMIFSEDTNPHTIDF